MDPLGNCKEVSLVHLEPRSVRVSSDPPDGTGAPSRPKQKVVVQPPGRDLPVKKCIYREIKKLV